jgi:glycosyltransferase involved in cell wall biosynthesis
VRSRVYNRYWSTGGGAEKYGGVIAELLSHRGPVELLTHDPLDLDWLAERLRLDLSRCTALVIDDTPRALTEAAGEVDLFVNVSFMSRHPAPHERSLYVVHFPTALDGHLPSWKKAIARNTRRFGGRSLAMSFEWGDGFHHRDGGRRAVAWTDGEATIRVVTEPDYPVPVRLVFGFQRPDAAGPADLRIDVDGEEAASADLERPPTKLERAIGRSVSVTVVSPAHDVPVDVTIRSTTFVPAELHGGDDARTLGVPLSGIQIGSGVLSAAARVMPAILTTALSSSWLGSYGAVVSNSSFTSRWVKRRWDVDSEVLFPPVTMLDRRPKEPIILNVGRFFPADQGHSKRQLELVEAFRDVVDRGHHDWSLHLVGGCDAKGESYLAQVREAAAGYPVVVHANAPGADLVELYGRASIYWHASGLGVDPEKDPDVLEHFGISTVEAMSAGAVPVVIGNGGLVETVRHGVDGYHFRSPAGLVAMTSSLIDDAGALARMSASAEERAHAFGIDAFGERLDAVVTRLVGG